MQVKPRHHLFWQGRTAFACKNVVAVARLDMERVDIRTTPVKDHETVTRRVLRVHDRGDEGNGGTDDGRARLQHEGGMLRIHAGTKLARNGFSASSENEGFPRHPSRKSLPPCRCIRETGHTRRTGPPPFSGKQLVHARRTALAGGMHMQPHDGGTPSQERSSSRAPRRAPVSTLYPKRVPNDAQPMSSGKAASMSKFTRKPTFTGRPSAESSRTHSSSRAESKFTIPPARTHSSNWLRPLTGPL